MCTTVCHNQHLLFLHFSSSLQKSWDKTKNIDIFLRLSIPEIILVCIAAIMQYWASSNYLYFCPLAWSVIRLLQCCWSPTQLNPTRHSQTYFLKKHFTCTICFAAISSVIKPSLFLSPYLINFPDGLLAICIKLQYQVSFVFSPPCLPEASAEAQKERDFPTRVFLFSENEERRIATSRLGHFHRCSWKKKKSLQKEFQCLKF